MAYDLNQLRSNHDTYFLLRVAHSLGQLQFVPFPTEAAAQVELNRVAPNGSLDTPYGIKNAEEFRNTYLHNRGRQAEGKSALEVIEVSVASLPVVAVERPQPPATVWPLLNIPMGPLS